MTQFDTILAGVHTSGVGCVVVGGAAVNLHAYQRFTKDVDLVGELVPDAQAEARNPRLRWIAAQLRRPSADCIAESDAPGDDA